VGPVFDQAVKNMYHKRTEKIGIEVPKNWEDCMRLNKENVNTLLQDAISKEMNNVGLAFQIFNGYEAFPPTYQEVCCHMFFDVKMEYLRLKARFIAGGHTTDTPHPMTYASFVLQESVIISITLAALNDLDVNMDDIENAYLMAPINEKIWTVLGPEFGDDAGNRALIVRDLYCFKSSGAAFSNHLAECMTHMGWKPCRADRDIWMKAET
jgi:hypothetical protein